MLCFAVTKCTLSVSDFKKQNGAQDFSFDYVFKCLPQIEVVIFVSKYIYIYMYYKCVLVMAVFMCH